MCKILFILSILLTSIASTSSYAQNLGKERIRKISNRKRALFFERGVFHNGKQSSESRLKSLRNSYSAKNKTERIVFDFSGVNVPRIYGYISKDNKTLYVDFFNTGIMDTLESFEGSRHVKDVNFYPLDTEMLSVEVSFKSNVTLDLFYLENPGRFVIDVKK